MQRRQVCYPRSRSDATGPFRVRSAPGAISRAEEGRDADSRRGCTSKSHPQSEQNCGARPAAHPEAPRTPWVPFQNQCDIVE